MIVIYNNKKKMEKENLKPASLNREIGYMMLITQTETHLYDYHIADEVPLTLYSTHRVVGHFWQFTDCASICLAIFHQANIIHHACEEQCCEELALMRLSTDTLT